MCHGYHKLDSSQKLREKETIQQVLKGATPLCLWVENMPAGREEGRMGSLGRTEKEKLSRYRQNMYNKNE